jgi:hypothetical protein
MVEDNPPTVPSEQPALSPDPVANAVGNALDRFARSFETSARRWEFVVYPALFAFSILATYGFFLIYSLTKDMSTLAQHVDPQMAANMGAMAEHIGAMSDNMDLMRQQIQKMANHIDRMDTNIAILNTSVGQMSENLDRMETHTSTISQQLDTLHPILANMQLMTDAMGRMTLSTGIMSREATQMGRPMSFMNQFAPW